LEQVFIVRVDVSECNLFEFKHFYWNYIYICENCAMDVNFKDVLQNMCQI